MLATDRIEILERKVAVLEHLVEQADINETLKEVSSTLERICRHLKRIEAKLGQ